MQWDLGVHGVKLLERLQLLQLGWRELVQVLGARIGKQNALSNTANRSQNKASRLHHVPFLQPKGSLKVSISPSRASRTCCFIGA